MSADDTSYASYRKFAEMIGSPVLDREAWDRMRFKLDKHESSDIQLRNKWLAADAQNSTNLATRRKVRG